MPPLSVRLLLKELGEPKFGSEDTLTGEVPDIEAEEAVARCPPAVAARWAPASDVRHSW